MNKIILIILTLLFSYNSNCQNDSILSLKIDELKGLFEQFNYTPISFNDTSLAVIKTISKKQSLKNYPSQSTYLEKRAEQLRKDLGLNLTGNYVENFNVDPVQDLEDNIGYRRRAQIGVEWELINNGYLENQVRARMMDDRIEREKLQNNIAIESQYYLQRFDETITVFNKLKIKLLHNRLQKLKNQHQIVRDLVLLKKIKKEQLLEVEIRLAEVESLLNVYKSYNAYLQVEESELTFDENNLPFFDLNYNVIFERIGIQTDSLIRNFKYSEYFKWYHQIGLRPYVRFNYYDIIDQNNRNFFSGGLGLTIPVSYSSKLNNEVENERWKYENERFIRDRSNLQEEVMNIGYDFRYQMKRFVDFYQKRKILNERLRIAKAKTRMSQITGDPFDGLDLYDDLLSSDIDLIDVLQNLYMKALKIHTKLPGVAINEIIEVKSADKLFEYIKPKKRNVYVWSKTFEEYTSAFLAEYAIFNEFNTIIVAVNESDTSTVKKSFMNFATENGEVYFMLGNNKLLYHKNIEGYLGAVLNNYENIQPKGIHLDIEPHTFDDWDENRRDLLNKYVLLVSQVKKFCATNALKLEISVPTYYDDYIMNQLFQLVDKVYFMCYENVKTDFLIRKLKPFCLENNEKVVIALRTEDFENRLDMENKINILQDSLSINEFAYHDLRRMISFDKLGLK